MPQTHELEAWSDLRSIDGTASLVQPLIRPLFRSWTDHEVLALLMGRGDASPYDLVRETWQPQGGDDFEGWWRRALHDGVIAGSAAATIAPATAKLPDLAPAAPAGTAMTLVLRPDPSLWDGTLCQQCVAAGMPEAADQAGVGQRAGAQSAGGSKARRRLPATSSRSQRTAGRSRRPSSSSPALPTASPASRLGSAAARPARSETASASMPTRFGPRPIPGPSRM